MADTQVAAAQQAAKSSRRWGHHPSLLSQKPALELVDRIKRSDLNPKHLHRPERLTIVDMLRWEGWGQAKIADLLKCSHRTVKRDIRVLKSRNAGLVKEYTVDRVADETVAMAEGLRQKALAKGDIATAWRITKELPEVLQSLGKLHKEPVQVDVNLQATLKTLVEHSTPEDIRQISAILRESVNVRRN